MTTKIEWCDEVWNVITGCSKISSGCQNCYAERTSKRLRGRFGYPEDDPFRVTFHPDRLDQPLKWEKPRHIFVCSMGDLWHENIGFDTIDIVLDVISRSSQHTFLILTKRPHRILEFDKWAGSDKPRWIPFSHVWYGVTAENQQTADERIPILLQIPAAKRFVSIEPMLGWVDIRKYLSRIWTPRGQDYPTEKTIGIDWVIAGGESGPRARPMHPDWVRSIRDQCQEAGVPFFFKQWGEWELAPWAFGDPSPLNKTIVYDGKIFEKTGKKEAGRLLAGREWNERP